MIKFSLFSCERFPVVDVSDVFPCMFVLRMVIVLGRLAWPCLAASALVGSVCPGEVQRFHLPGLSGIYSTSTGSFYRP